jgi:hypothetical protein
MLKIGVVPDIFIEALTAFVNLSETEKQYNLVMSSTKEYKDDPKVIEILSNAYTTINNPGET